MPFIEKIQIFKDEAYILRIITDADNPSWS